jgi:hypothetical protein
MKRPKIRAIAAMPVARTVTKTVSGKGGRRRAKLPVTSLQAATPQPTALTPNLKAPPSLKPFRGNPPRSL